MKLTIELPDDIIREMEHITDGLNNYLSWENTGDKCDHVTVGVALDGNDKVLPGGSVEDFINKTLEEKNIEDGSAEHNKLYNDIAFEPILFSYDENGSLGSVVSEIWNAVLKASPRSKIKSMKFKEMPVGSIFECGRGLHHKKISDNKYLQEYRTKGKANTIDLAMFPESDIANWEYLVISTPEKQESKP